MVFIHHYDSPLGRVTLASGGDALTGLWFDGQRHFGETLALAGGAYSPELPDVREEGSLPVFREAERWLDVYFGGREPDFTPPLSLNGSPFRKAVWEILLTIPYGHTATYGEIARLVRPGAQTSGTRAVGGAVGHNPVSLIVPCHRVIGSDGSLTGYAGGIARKLKLLELEGVDAGKLRIPSPVDKRT